MDAASKKIFIKALTEGIVAFGAKNGREEEFCRTLCENISGSFFHYIEGDYQMLDVHSNSTVVCENRYAPLLRMLVLDELIIFRAEEKLDFESDRVIAGEFVLEVLRFVTAWNKKMSGVLNPDFKVSALNKRYSVKEYIKRYNDNNKKIKKDNSAPIV